jgi:hypothetical protein
MLRIATQCSAKEGRVWIIYLEKNEVRLPVHMCFISNIFGDSHHLKLFSMFEILSEVQEAETSTLCREASILKDEGSI